MKTLFSLLLCMLVTQSIRASDSASFADFDQKAKAGGPVSVVFFGGSLTWGANASDPQKTSWRGLMMDYLQKKYPHTVFAFHDASIGGTGSKLGMFRFERDVMAYKPDLVFYDFTCNDNLDGTDIETLGSYEGLLRKMVGAGIPVVQEFFCFKFNMNPTAPPPTRYVAHQKLADAYHTATADAMALVRDAVNTKKTDINALWPLDGAHPGDQGYELFFEAVRDGFEKAVAEGAACVVPKDPVFSDQYKTATRQILVDGTLPKGWVRHLTYRTSLWYDGLSSRWMGDVALCAAKTNPSGDNEPLTVDFTGTMVGLFGERAGNSLPFKVKIDGKQIQFTEKNKPPVDIWPTDLQGRATPGWKDSHLFSWIELTDKLAPGKHTLEIEPVFDQANPTGELRIESVCSAGE